MERYLKEGILALVPGEGTRVYTRKGEYGDKRGLDWLVGRLGKELGLDVVRVRQSYGEFLGRKQNIPLPLSPGLVLLPLKMGGKGTGYVNGVEVAGFGEEGIRFAGGLVLPCLNTGATVRQRLQQGEAVLEEYLGRQGLAREEEIPGARFFMEHLLSSLFRG